MGHIDIDFSTVMDLTEYDSMVMVELTDNCAIAIPDHNIAGKKRCGE